MALKRVTLAAGVASAFTFAGIGLFACGDSVAPVNELIVAVDTTGLIPSTGYQMYLNVQQAGTSKLYPFLVGNTSDPTNKLLTQTLGLVGQGSDEPVTIQLLTTTPSGSTNVAPIAVRSVTTTIPHDRIGLLRLPIDALCFNAASIAGDAGVSGSANPAFPASVCDAGETCISGSCQSDAVDAASLASFTSTSGLSGGNNGVCFSVDSCFLSSATTAFRTSLPVAVVNGACTVTVPSGIDLTLTNVGVPVNSGFCTSLADPEATGECVVPLDYVPAGGQVQLGWSSPSANPYVLELPPGICTGPAAQPMVVVSTNCLSKVPTTPLCGPWSAVTNVQTSDGGAPIGDASLAMADSGSATIPDFPATPYSVDDIGAITIVHGTSEDGGIAAATDFALSDGGVFLTFQSSAAVARFPLSQTDYPPRTEQNGETAYPLDGSPAVSIVHGVEYVAPAKQLVLWSDPDDYKTLNADPPGAVIAVYGPGALDAGVTISSFVAGAEGVYDVDSVGELSFCTSGKCATISDPLDVYEPVLASNSPGTGFFAVQRISDDAGASLDRGYRLHDGTAADRTLVLPDMDFITDLKFVSSNDRLYYSGQTLVGTPGHFYSDIGTAAPGSAPAAAVLIAPAGSKTDTPGALAATSKVVYFYDDGTFIAPDGGPPALAGPGIYGCVPSLPSQRVMPTDPLCSDETTHLVVDFSHLSAAQQPVLKMQILGRDLFWLGSDGVVRGFAIPPQLQDP